MAHPRSHLPERLIVGAFFCATIVSLSSLLDSVNAAGNTLREIRGTVQAVSPKDAPPTIVVKSLHNEEEIVVGAMVKPGASLLRGTRPINLDQIHPGDTVTLKYVKTREGLIVRSIVLHPY